MRFVKWVLLLLSVSLPVCGCNHNISCRRNTFVLQPGDLLFQDLDCGPLCDAIERVTTGYQRASFSHIGIAARDGDGNFVVIEAVSSGVEATPLQLFSDRSFDVRGRPKVVVGRLRKPWCHLIPLALEEAYALEGKAYDKVFALNNGAYYCSELIYEIFLRANNGNAVFDLQPMTFRDPDTGRRLPAWEEYFSLLGVPIPEGEPGINPGGISRSSVLEIVYAYGTPSRSAVGQKTL